MNRNSMTSEYADLAAGPIGECVGMLLIANAIFSGTAWVAQLRSWPSGVALCLCSMWIIVRVLTLAPGAIAASVSFCGTAAVTLISREIPASLPSWLQVGPFSPMAYLVMLLMLAAIDSIAAMRNATWLRSGISGKFQPFVSRHRHRIWGWGIAGLFLAYLVLLPVIDMWRTQDPVSNIQVLEEETLSQRVRLQAMQVLASVWFFALGATVGSFLNVVVYRVPRGKSLILARSHCPSCGSAIATRDNIPILGWIWLRGRCRTCDTPISARYPAVEFTTAVLFLLLYFVELISGGANLPVRVPNAYAGVVWIIFYTKWDLVRYYLLHCYLLCVLFTWALICYDGFRVPARSIITTFAWPAIAIIIWPSLQLTTIGPFMPARRELSLPQGLLAMVVGGLGGSIVGMLVARVLNGGPKREVGREREFVAGLALIGWILGWQAMLGVTFVCSIFVCVQRAFGQSLPLIATLCAAALCHQLVWRSLVESASPWWPGPETRLPQLLAGVGSLAILLTVGRYLHREGDPSPTCSTGSL